MKLYTEVEVPPLPVSIGLKDKIMVLGSCFADNIGAKMTAAGFDVCVNPFGTLYNPASLASALQRLESAIPFGPEDCVGMGAGAGLVCSFHHHTSFAAKTADEFLSGANSSLSESVTFWRECNKVIVTAGTAMVWKHNGNVVSNCLKRPAGEFTHELLSVDETADCFEGIMTMCGKRGCIFTVSPIRHLSLGAHCNTISKATLQIGLEKALSMDDKDGGVCYFPAYEIMNDELRDYRFYAEDLCHPSTTAVEYLWERFIRVAVPESEHLTIKANEKAARRLSHRPLH